MARTGRSGHRSQSRQRSVASSSAATPGSPPSTRSLRVVWEPFDLVLLEIGAFHLALLGGGLLLPIHWGTFNLALHAWDQPIKTLLELAPAAGAEIVVPRLGDAFEPARVDGVTPWWRGVDSRDDETSQPEPEEPADPASASLQWPLD